MNSLGLTIPIFLLYALFSVKLSADEALPDTLTRIKPAVVAVGTFAQKRNPRAIFLGTGFAVADGSAILTNAHVLPKPKDNNTIEQIAVFYRQDNQEKMLNAKIIAVDDAHDAALLKLTEHTLPPLQLGDATSVREGKSYAFTGYPIGMVLGLYPATHQGIISAISPDIIPVLRSTQINSKLLKRFQDPYNIFQLDAIAYPGNSGSPLYDKETGKVIGVINKVFVQENKENILSKPSGISYAIPITYFQKLLAENGFR